MNSFSKAVTLVNQRGLHARASAKFVGLASKLDTAISVEREGQSVIGTSIMGLMMLGAACGDTIRISADGEGGQDAVNILAALVEDGFGEG
ncbi:MAG: HPr family phosphocarrier protein [Alphaproteobacteria bacterium]|nr:HPr family phosphocarrier protein [Alphaproteobacteria bacterium]MDE2339929.1 HPr family phosphocarrier protein [Alphaproteobacteria bacterium]